LATIATCNASRDWPTELKANGSAEDARVDGIATQVGRYFQET
jgi:hypothetical protein